MSCAPPTYTGRGFFTRSRTVDAEPVVQPDISWAVVDAQPVDTAIVAHVHDRSALVRSSSSRHRERVMIVCKV